MKELGMHSKKFMKVALIAFVGLIVAIMPYSPLQNDVSAACPNVKTWYKYKEMYGTRHALSIKHTYQGNCHGPGYKYKSSFVGLDPQSAKNIVKKSNSNGSSGWYQVNYKWKNWTGYQNSCYQKQTGNNSKGYTGYSAGCPRS